MRPHHGPNSPEEHFSGEAAKTELRETCERMALALCDLTVQLTKVFPYIQDQSTAESALRSERRNSETQLLTYVSHELRSPLQAILSFAYFGREEASTADREVIADYFSKIESHGARLLEMLNDILDFARLEANQIQFRFVPTDLADLARSVAEEFSLPLLEHRLRMEVIDHLRSPAVVDELRIQQVIRNLVGNAIKFSDPGGTIEVRIDATEHHILVAVTDEGIGIPTAELEVIFDKFKQSSRNKAIDGGTGLGLSICREIVSCHGGRIWAENRRPRGAAFTFEIARDLPRMISGEEGVINRGEGRDAPRYSVDSLRTRYGATWRATRPGLE